ncbi:MAG: AI-2E family transporter [Acidobacteria bacterium]|nr:AI-2E family transporter [Acidobacteriota bacterium]
MIKKDYPFWFFILLLLLVVYLFFNIFRPFFLIFLWAAILVSTSYPIYRKLVRWTRGRQGLCAALMTIAITLIIILPIVLIILVVTQESIEAYRSISSRINTMEIGTWQQFSQHESVLKIKEFISQYVNLEDLDLKNTVVDVLRYVSSFLVSQSQNIFSGAARTFFQFFLLLVATYYFFREGEAILRELRKLSPLDAAREERVLAKFTDVVSATMLGNFVTAAVQGILGGLGFLIVGLPSPVLWGTVMAFLALVPVVGAFLVWIPAVVYLLYLGAYGKAIFLLIWGSVIVGLSDNFLKPMIIKGKANLHPIIIFFSILGGLSFFGFSGLVLGPLITAMTFVFFEIYREEFKDSLAGTGKLNKQVVESILARKNTLSDHSE